MAVIDTNSDPDFIDYPIPGNDDSIKAIQLYCDIIDKALNDIKIVRTEKRIIKKKGGAQVKKERRYIGNFGSKENGKSFENKKSEKE
jgi:small subunit ribosomal protein S2